MYQDAALEYLRMKGEETPIGSVVKIIVVRSKFNQDDSEDSAARTKIKYRVIKGV